MTIDQKSHNIFISSVVVVAVVQQNTELIIIIFVYTLLQLLYTNGSSNDIHQSHCDPLAFTTHHNHHDEIKTIRGKSLSPPNLRPNRRQTIPTSSYVYYNRSHQRYLIRPFSTIRRLKLLAKAKQQQAAVTAARKSPLSSPLSPTARTDTTMGKTIANIDLKTASAGDGSVAIVKQQPKDASGKPIDDESDSEYSSLEDNDDDNNQGE